MTNHQHCNDPDLGQDAAYHERLPDHIPLKERLAAIPAAFAVFLPMMVILSLVLFIALVLINLIP